MNARCVRYWRMFVVSCRTCDRCAMNMNASTRIARRSLFVATFLTLPLLVDGESPAPVFAHTTNDSCITVTRFTGKDTTLSVPDTIDGIPVTTIGARAFIQNTNLTSVTLTFTVTSIGEAAFAGCTKLTNVVIPASVTNIGLLCFYGCSRLSEISIPRHVRNIGGQAFGVCQRLVSIMVDESNSTYSSSEGVLFDKSRRILIQYPSGKRGHYSVPGNIKTIERAAFNACANLTSVTIPNIVTNISDDAFRGCYSLTNVTLPNGNLTIGNRAFKWCLSLREVRIPSNTVSIGDRAFSGCTNLLDVFFQASVPQLGEKVFENVSVMRNAGTKE